MKLMNKAVLFLLLTTCAIGTAQDMNKEFSNLEKGEFDKAEVFFENILKDYPENKTARLCYARAIGLNNQAEKALVLFTTLKKDNPGDLEIELNYAEALLWNKKFDAAKTFYSGLVERNPTNFVAHLGYANTLSNLKEYKDALFYVNKALVLSPANPGALISRKYIKLGYANEKVNQKLYAEAEAFYEEILVDFPGDKETLLNKANLFLITKNIEKGKETYTVLATTDPILALNGLSLIEHIDGKDKKALEIAEEAVQKAAVSTDEALVKQTQERYVQALIWNKKYKEAQAKIEELNTQYKNENWLLALSATLGVYRSDFKESIGYYATILENDSKSFDGNLGISNAYYADGEIHKALDAVDKTLEIFKNQNDAVNFLKKIKEEHTPTLEEKVSYAFDNGKNTAKASLTSITVPVSTKFAFNTTYQYRETENTITKASAKTNDFLVGVDYKFHPKISYTFNAGVTSANSNTSKYNQALIHTFFKIKPLKLQDLEIGYKREIQNFNSDLIDKEIAANNYYLNYNLSTNFNFGWFTQYFYTSQTDNNTRNLLFTSFYYNFMSNPVLKGGLNYQYIAFKNQVPNDYFSPSKFNAVEIFIELLKDEKIAKVNSWFYNANLATGYQFIENNDKQLTYRVQAKLGYKFSDRLLANVYGIKSNIASVSVAGFTYTEMGLRLKWNLFDKPIFDLK
jgi:tetratricopeptide (TPR) repeat protein